jgi:hypothetical protein
MKCSSSHAFYTLRKRQHRQTTHRSALPHRDVEMGGCNHRTVSPNNDHKRLKYTFLSIAITKQQPKQLHSISFTLLTTSPPPIPHPTKNSNLSSHVTCMSIRMLLRNRFALVRKKALCIEVGVYDSVTHFFHLTLVLPSTLGRTPKVDNVHRSRTSYEAINTIFRFGVLVIS